MYIEQDSEYRIITSDFSDIVGKTRFTTEITLIKCLSGSAVIAIDSIEHTLMDQHSFMLSEYMIFQVKTTTADFRVSCISVSLPFYYEIVAGFDGDIFNVLLHSVPELYKESDLKASDLLFENLCILNSKEYGYKRSMAMNLIACYIYEMYELTLPHIRNNGIINKKSVYSDTIISFYNLVSSNGYKNRNIDFYAEKLNMSSRYLYKIVQCTCHITPKQLIDDVVISLIKQLLLTSSLTNQQISDKFGFTDQSAFGQYFKRCVGVAPSIFRDKHK